MFEPQHVTARSTRVIAAIMLMALLLSGCDLTDDDGDAIATATPVPPIPSEPSTPPTATPAPTATAAPQPEPTVSEEPLPPVVETVLDQAAQDFNVPRSSVTLQRYVEKLWPSTALGCPEPGQSYAQIVVSGFQVIVSIDKVTVTYHTGDGRIIRCANPAE